MFVDEAVLGSEIRNRVGKIQLQNAAISSEGLESKKTRLAIETTERLEPKQKIFHRFAMRPGDGIAATVGAIMCQNHSCTSEMIMPFRCASFKKDA